MKLKHAKALVASCGLFLVAVPLWAHHSFASEFSVKKPISMTGTITKLDWINPHCYLELDAKDERGNVQQHWRLEFGAPMALRRAGMKQDMLTPGQTVTITGYAAKEDIKLGWVNKFIFPDGRVIQMTPDSNDATNPDR